MIETLLVSPWSRSVHSDKMGSCWCQGAVWAELLPGCVELEAEPNNLSVAPSWLQQEGAAGQPPVIPNTAALWALYLDCFWGITNVMDHDYSWWLCCWWFNDTVNMMKYGLQKKITHRLLSEVMPPALQGWSSVSHSPPPSWTAPKGITISFNYFTKLEPFGKFLR